MTTASAGETLGESFSGRQSKRWQRWRWKVLREKHFRWSRFVRPGNLDKVHSIKDPLVLDCRGTGDPAEFDEAVNVLWYSNRLPLGGASEEGSRDFGSCAGIPHFCACPKRFRGDHIEHCRGHMQSCMQVATRCVSATDLQVGLARAPDRQSEADRQTQGQPQTDGRPQIIIKSQTTTDGQTITYNHIRLQTITDSNR